MPTGPRPESLEELLAELPEDIRRQAFTHSSWVEHRAEAYERLAFLGDVVLSLPALQAIEHFIGQKIPRLKLENFPYLYTALFESESATSGRRAIGGGRTHRGYSFGRRR